MTFDDFCRYFVSLAVCQRINTSSLSLEKAWNELLINGEWALPHRVGGCINYRRTFLNNPQVCSLRSENARISILGIISLNKHRFLKLVFVTTKIYEITFNKYNMLISSVAWFLDNFRWKE